MTRPLRLGYGSTQILPSVDETGEFQTSHPRNDALEGPLAPEGLVVTNRVHQRTDTAIDLDTGHARAALTFEFFTEPS